MATIQSLEIRNFKILKNRTIRFETGINKILGGNSCGKSTIGAAFRFVTDCKEKKAKQAPNGNVKLVLRLADGSLQSYEKVKEGTRVVYKIDDRDQLLASYKDSLASHGITADFSLNIAANEDWHNVLKLFPNKIGDFIASFTPHFAESIEKIKKLKIDIEEEEAAMAIRAPQSQPVSVLLETQKRELEALEQELQRQFEVDIAEFAKEVNRLLTLLIGDDVMELTLAPINALDASKGVKASLKLNNAYDGLSVKQKKLLALAFMLAAMSKTQAKFIILDNFDYEHFVRLETRQKPKLAKILAEFAVRYQLITTSSDEPFRVGYAINLPESS